MLESFVTKSRDKKAASKSLKKAMKKHGRCEQSVTDKLRSYGTALKDLGASDLQETERWLNNRGENSHLPFRGRERAILRFRRLMDGLFRDFTVLSVCSVSLPKGTGAVLEPRRPR